MTLEPSQTPAQDATGAHPSGAVAAPTQADSAASPDPMERLARASAWLSQSPARRRPQDAFAKAFK